MGGSFERATLYNSSISHKQPMSNATIEGITICGETYYPSSEYRIIDGVVYVEDENHFGTIWMTEEMVSKYNLQDIAFRDEDEDEDFWGDLKSPELCYEIPIDHACGFIDPATGKLEQITPHGQAYSEEFAAWWNEFPVQLLSEPEDKVWISGWADG